MRSQFSQLFARNRAISLNKTTGRQGKKSDSEQEKDREREQEERLRILELIEEVSFCWATNGERDMQNYANSHGSVTSGTRKQQRTTHTIV